MLILKLGDRGTLTYRSSEKEDYRSFFATESFANHVVDPIGAGDALLAYATLAMVATGTETIASILGSFAAAIECETAMIFNSIAMEKLLSRIDKIGIRSRTAVSKSMPVKPIAASPQTLIHKASGRANLAPMANPRPYPNWVVLPQPI